MGVDYKTDYSKFKNVDTMDKGSYNDWGDGTPAKQVLAKQAPGEIFNVDIVPDGITKYIYNDVSSVAAGGEVLINTYTVGPSIKTLARNILLSGENRGQFIVKINSDPIATARTFYTEYNAIIPIDDLELLESDKIEIFVINRGAMPAPFESTIGVVEYAI